MPTIKSFSHHRRAAWLSVFLLSSSMQAFAQTEMSELLARMFDSNPAVKAAQSQRRGAEIDIDSAKLQRWPSISVSQESNGLVASVSQPLWTAGALTGKIRAAEENFSALDAQVEVTRLQLGLRLIDAVRNLQSASGALKEQEETLKQFARYQSMMQRRVDAQVSPGVELSLLSTRVLQMQTAAAESRAARQVALGRINELVGDRLSAAQIDALSAGSNQDVLRTWATSESLERVLADVPQSASVRKARFDSQAAEETLKVQEAQRWPQVSARYQRYLTYKDSVAKEDIQGRFWVGMTYTPGAGFSSFTQAKAAAARASALVDGIDVAARDVTEAVRVDWEDLNSSLRRQGSLALAIDGASDVLDSYERQFIVGRKTWQDVLNASRELNQNRVALVDAKASAAAAYWRLRARSSMWQLTQ